MAYVDRITAWNTLLATLRTNNTTLVSVMATVSLNTISAQNITDINAAIAAISAAYLAGNAAIVKPD